MLDHEAKPEHWAAEAERLLKDPALLRAVTAMKHRALDALMRCDPTDLGDVSRFQAQALCADEFLNELGAMVLSFDDGYSDPLQ